MGCSHLAQGIEVQVINQGDPQDDKGEPVHGRRAELVFARHDVVGGFRTQHRHPARFQPRDQGRIQPSAFVAVVPSGPASSPMADADEERIARRDFEAGLLFPAVQVLGVDVGVLPQVRHPLESRQVHEQPARDDAVPEKVDATPGRPLLNAIFRGIHSIKGAAGSLGFTAIADFTHHVEGVLDRLRLGVLMPDRDALNSLLSCVDYSRILVLAARDGKSVDADRAEHLVAELEGLSNANAPPPVSVPSQGNSAGPTLTTRYRIRFEPSRAFFQSGNDPLRLLRVLDGMGEMTVKADLSDLPGNDDFDPEQCYLAWDIELVTVAPRTEIEEVFSWVQDDCILSIDSPDQSASKPIEPQPAGPGRGHLVDNRRDRVDRRVGSRRTEDTDLLGEARAEYLNVSRDKVDDLINLVGELSLRGPCSSRASRHWVRSRQRALKQRWCSSNAIRETFRRA